MSPAVNFFNQMGHPLGIPAKDKEGSTRFVLVEDVEEFAGYRLEAALLGKPIVSGDMALEVEDLIPVLQIKREGINRFGRRLEEHRSRADSVLFRRILLLHLFQVTEVPETLLHLF